MPQPSYPDFRAWPHVRPFVRSGVDPFFRSSVRPFACGSAQSIAACFHDAWAPFVRSCVRPFVRSFCNTPSTQLPTILAPSIDASIPYTHCCHMSHTDTAKFISFASPKGGVGKSTSCLAIAGALLAAGEKVRIIDFDQTETIWRWYSDSATAKAIPNLTVEKGPTTDLDSYIGDLYATATDYVLIDLAGALTDLTVMVAAFATLIITPAKVSEPDIIEANKMADKLLDVSETIGKRLNHLILLNEVPSSISKDEVDLIRQIDGSDLNRFQTMIYRRAAYSKSFSRGTMPHLAKTTDPKAIKEINGLVDEIRAILEPQQLKAAA